MCAPQEGGISAVASVSGTKEPEDGCDKSGGGTECVEVEAAFSAVWAMAARAALVEMLRETGERWTR